MSMRPEMTVTLRLPTRTLFEAKAIALTAVGPDGAFGIWPNHIDFVSALVPSVLTLRLADDTQDGDEEIFGLDEGMLVKKGHHVTVATLRGVRGEDLTTLQEMVQSSFVQMDEEERLARSALSRLEADMVRRFAELRRPQP
ncbi:F0F1 ATP synthase subunit epsilon [Phaeobacter sp. CECT 5382]|uniref:ATPase n=1 Tax=Rhodobacterales TaxID=204455 RepID=UPI0006DA3F84|nr:ATPase [Phaeobacter sp. CECT 5382]CUH89226.1 F0F1 ATP synthase subunit epsilon [Phaeobacter sp. CECT 5382]